MFRLRLACIWLGLGWLTGAVRADEAHERLASLTATQAASEPLFAESKVVLHYAGGTEEFTSKCYRVRGQAGTSIQGQERILTERVVFGRAATSICSTWRRIARPATCEAI